MSTTLPAMVDPRPASRFLTRDECAALLQRAARFADLAKGKETTLSISGRWMGNLRWARNRVISSGDVRDNRLFVGRGASVQINQLDDAALEAAVRRAERIDRTAGAPDFRPSPIWRDSFVPPAPGQPKIWSDTTYNVSAEQRADLLADLLRPIQAAGMQGAGYLEVSATGDAVMNATNTLNLYYPSTQSQYSVTVRDPEGTGSGWAGSDHYDWGKINPQALTAIALDKCLRSRNPVRVEPGRYTVILEPQAVADLVQYMFPPPHRFMAEGEGLDSVFSKGKGRSKLGEQIIDPRISISTDMNDPDMGFVPFTPTGQAWTSTPVSWVRDGILTNMMYTHDYALKRLGRIEAALVTPGSFRMTGGTSTLAEMIASTKRGIYITRFWDVRLVDYASLLLSGYTRDGTWLIENNRITKPVKNFRFTESPAFILNKVEMLGAPTRVFRPGMPTVVPALKVTDFSLTSLSDAV